MYFVIITTKWSNSTITPLRIRKFWVFDTSFKLFYHRILRLCGEKISDFLLSKWIDKVTAKSQRAQRLFSASSASLR